MSKIFIVYSHYDEKSFNNAIKDTFIKEAKEEGHTIDLVDLYKEKFDPVEIFKINWKSYISWLRSYNRITNRRITLFVR